MATLVGHTIPGVIFFILGLWWAVISLWTHLRSRGLQKSRNQKQDGLDRKSWLPQPFYPRVPIEPLYLLLIPLVGIVAEGFFVAVDEDDGAHIKTQVYKLFKNGKVTNVSKLHHLIMYGSFMLSGIMDIASLYIKLPRHTSHLFFSLAFWIEGWLWYMHSHDRDPSSSQAHWLISMLSFSCAIFSLLRMLQPMNLLINAGLASSILLQGTWLTQTALIVFSWINWLKEQPMKHEMDSLDEHIDKGYDRKATMLISACFALHLLGIALLMVLLWVVLQLILRREICLYQKNQRGRCPLTSVDANHDEEKERLISTELESAPKDSQTAAMELQDITETTT